MVRLHLKGRDSTGFKPDVMQLFARHKLDAVKEHLTRTINVRKFAISAPAAILPGSYPDIMLAMGGTKLVEVNRPAYRFSGTKSTLNHKANTVKLV